ncbi:DNA polymerase subunit Cdc27 [Hypoxylon trugodes]|uniref:DNA polymerase subunit Cdc27 n=1 Tax=Hypoxylon trugodes TaxID=326681 RepID=UPI0021995A10|nr:DNA polymerase subunit Cdc27 [Hypoxylon trugodes]KAI1383681.1 DNA polymerase subunit Cdc27 [Hypoxylon trugodes]
MDDYKQYLAQKILTEDQLVTYRLLSRALKVHVNTAKEMLYEFHKWQNPKRPGSLHATYIVYGIKKNIVKVEERDGDVEMTDSQVSEDQQVPFSDEIPTYTLSLIREEQLQDTLAAYDEVTSIHIYSLGPHPLKDLQLLADTARQVLSLSTTGDLPASSKDFGSIANPHVRKRERRGPASRPVASAPAAKPAPQPQVIKEEKPTTVKEEPKLAPQAIAKGPAPAATKKSTAAAPMKRQGSSGIGQMFAKAAAKPKKPAAKPAAEEDQKMALSDDGEDDAEPMPEAKESASARQSRKDRQAELRRMMEESEDEEPEKEDSPAEEPEEEEPPPPEPEPKTEEPAEIVSSTGDGRKRGRRRVTRKKQVMDDKGYLVTIQEQGWESFSEDEAPPPPKSKPPPVVKSEPAAKSKKAAAGKGQGNIMSFFSKK